MKLDAHSINQAYSYFYEQLTMHLPGVWEQEYAALWAEEGRFLPAAVNLDLGTDSITSYQFEGVGEGVEISDLADDIPMVALTQDKETYNVKHFALSYGYSIFDLAKQAKAGVNLNTQKISLTDRGLRQMVHNQILFGVSAPGKTNRRGLTGLFNNPNVPIQATGYNPNTATWDDNIQFLLKEITKVAQRNELSAGISFVLTDSAHMYSMSHEFKDGINIKTAMEGILRDNFPTFQGIFAVPECSPEKLELFGIKPQGTNQTRMILMPEDSNIISHARMSPTFLDPERRGVTFKVAAIHGTSELMIHRPQEMAYVDFPRFNMN